MLQRVDVFFFRTREGQVGDAVAFVFPVLKGGGVEGGVFGGEDEERGVVGEEGVHCAWFGEEFRGV